MLLDQPTIRDDKVTVSQLVAQASAKTGENIQVNRFVRFRVGETMADEASEAATATEPAAQA